MEQIYFHGFTDEEDRKVKQRMEDFKKISQTARIPEAGMNELKNHINMVFYDLDSVVDEVNASMKSVQDMIELEPIDTTSLAESFDDVKSYINKKEEMIAMLDADFCNNEISELEKLIFATKNLIQDYKNSDRHIERYQTGDYIDRGHFLELYEALAKSQIYNQTNATGIQEAIEHQNQISREIYEELESEERFEAGFMQVVGGALVAVSAIATVASCGAAYPALNVTAAGLATVGTADATEGVQEMYYGLQCDVETKSFHAIRDTVFRGNEEHYQYFNSALNIASLVIFPVSMGAKTAASKGTSMVAGGAKNLAIAGASTLAGYGVEKFAEQQGASNTTTMALGLITSILTEKGLENRTSAVTKRIKAYANSTDTLKLKVRIQNTLPHKKTAIKVTLSNGRERVLELKNGFWEKGSKFLENVEKLKNGDFYQHEYVMPEGYRVKVSDFDDVPKNRTVYSRGSGESGSNLEHMLGAKGTQVSSKTTWQNGKTERIDVENPAPGERPGQVHYHDPNNNKYYYDIDNNTFYDQKTGELAPKGIQKLLKDKEFMKGIKKALQILGE